MIGRDKADLWRWVVSALLCLALAMPALASGHFVHSEGSQGHVHEQSVVSPEGHRHGPSADALGDHCHPGLDCLAAAIVEFQRLPQSVYDTGRFSGVAIGTSAESIEAGFDPPPPRRHS